MYDLLTELALPWFKSLFPAPEQAPSQTKDGWLLEPSEEDAALSLTGSVDKAHESLIGRLIELGPKVFLLCYVHSYAVMTSAQVIAAALAECGVFGRLVSLSVEQGCTWGLAKRPQGGSICGPSAPPSSSPSGSCSNSR